ncbi:MAG: 23S rRNA pseudouridine(2604) synthase RluF [Bdellovibrio sp. CG12_big_fil_rev_8_21_14_0_65_39_13]|nr:MAG: 23S rRNA pseudouridine(2604) synthase RluF [Bdellovibrio sp. CG22_combo_CG10-13_8_21_14_all_39_27]PIQ59448.1 MAG: 23S rRNA pseudouridine(2604) synthase RluF [Bdellovibrio sp. CG12_big_fil_rev_8_21_14_0_65_39_13]PIR36578.1 MAG: 23S rRNA pseudouridine(2604) synthase RluF [Bdellovibrio sp. CG11_big_fil_rev_8_21_14_0_20_39_38]
MSSVRLNKYISQSGYCSRREADEFIENRKVKINGKVAETGAVVNPGDRVTLHGNVIEPREEEKMFVIALNKPVGIVSTTEGSERSNIVDFINHPVRIFPIGRLDKDSQGLIFLTNNGDIVNKILRAGNNHEKEYVVTVNRPITEEFIEKMAKGVPILGVVTKKCKVEKVSQNVFRITLIQGLNRQIRRMCEYFNYEVTKLERVRIMHISLKGISVGDWRELDEKEMKQLMALIEDSSSEKKVKPQKQTNNPKPKSAQSNPNGPLLAKRTIKKEHKVDRRNKR